MPAGSNTKSDIGIRRIITSVSPAGYRNFEANGSQTYVVAADKGYDYKGTHYAKGATIPYDAAGNTKYGDPVRLERDYNRRVIDPSS